MVLRVWFLYQQHSITQEFVRNANSWVPPQSYPVRNSGGETQPSVSQQALQVMIVLAKIWNQGSKVIFLKVKTNHFTSLLETPLIIPYHIKSKLLGRCVMSFLFCFFQVFSFHFLPPTQCFSHLNVLKYSKCTLLFVPFPSTPLPTHNLSTWRSSIHLSRCSLNVPFCRITSEY